jgi:hypothetical protein
MKNSSHNPVESIEKQHFKKKFLERKLQEEDANEQIKTYTHGETATSIPLPETSHVDETRKL